MRYAVLFLSLAACGSSTTEDGGSSDSGIVASSDASTMTDAGPIHDGGTSQDAGVLRDAETQPGTWAALVLAGDGESFAVLGSDLASGVLTELDQPSPHVSRADGVVAHANGQWIYATEFISPDTTEVFEGVVDVASGSVDWRDRDASSVPADGLVETGDMRELLIAGDLLVASDSLTEALRVYHIDANTGALTATTTFSLADWPRGLAYRDGIVYVTLPQANMVRVLTIAELLRGTAPLRSLSVESPIHMRLHPTLDVGYVVEDAPQRITMASLTQDGSLVATDTFVFNGRIKDIGFAPNGDFAYVGSSEGVIIVLSVDLQTGALTDTGLSQASPQLEFNHAYVFSADGAFLYVGTSRHIDILSRDVRTGALAPAGESNGSGGAESMVIVPR